MKQKTDLKCPVFQKISQGLRFFFSGESISITLLIDMI